MVKEKEIEFDQVLTMRYECMRTIEYIKNRMLQFMYYTTLLQFAIIIYHSYIEKNNFFVLNSIILSIISLLIGWIFLYFTMQYNIDYQFYSFRSEVYLEVLLPEDLQRVLKKPQYYDKICDLKDISKEDVMELYFKKIWDQPFQILYYIINWGISLMVTMLLMGNVISGNDLYFKTGHILVGLIFILIFVYTIITVIIRKKARIKYLKLVEKHLAYVKKNG